MNEHTADNDALRQRLTDFAEWQGESREDAEWAAETYMRESADPAASEPSAGYVEALLSEHWFVVRNVVPGARWVGCECGWQQPEDNRNQQRHNAHIAAALASADAACTIPPAMRAEVTR